MDKTQLTEALDIQTDMANRWEVLEAAARLLLDFPTDEQVDAGINALDRVQADDQVVRDVLGAVRRSMIGDTDD